MVNSPLYRQYVPHVVTGRAAIPSCGDVVCRTDGCREGLVDGVDGKRSWQLV